MKKTKHFTKKNNTSQKQSYLKENMFDLISVIISIISLITSIYIGVQANEISAISQPLEYSVTVADQIKVFEYDGKMYSTDSVDFVQTNGFQAGSFSSMFVSTVHNDVVETVYVPYKSDEAVAFTHTSNEDIKFHLSNETNYKLVFTPCDMSKTETINDSLHVFHIMFKGYNKEFTIYSVAFTLDGKIAPETLEKDGEPISLPVGTINCYVLNEDNIYEYKNYQQIAEDLNGNSSNPKFTSKEIFETIINERKLCNEKMQNSH